VNEAYAAKQIVGIDVHRRWSVLVQMTDAGQRLETVRMVSAVSAQVIGSYRADEGTALACLPADIVSTCAPGLRQSHWRLGLGCGDGWRHAG
jgi:hypothetical protein